MGTYQSKAHCHSAYGTWCPNGVKGTSMALPGPELQSSIEVAGKPGDCCWSVTPACTEIELAGTKLTHYCASNPNEEWTYQSKAHCHSAYGTWCPNGVQGTSMALPEPELQSTVQVEGGK